MIIQYRLPKFENENDDKYTNDFDNDDEKGLGNKKK